MGTNGACMTFDEQNFDGFTVVFIRKVLQKKGYIKGTILNYC